MTPALGGCFAGRIWAVQGRKENDNVALLKIGRGYAETGFGMKGQLVLCGSNYYEQKYYFNEEAFGRLPQQVKEELRIMCVLFTEDVGGALFLEFDPEEGLLLRTECDENDLLYDEIGSVLKAKALQEEKRELLESLELYYRVFILGQPGKG